MPQILNAFLICLAPIMSDGDTLRCANTEARVRVFGIRSEDKTEADARAKAAGQEIAKGGLTCEIRGTTFNRVSAICYNGYGVDLGGALIQAKLVTEWCSFSKNRYGTCE